MQRRRITETGIMVVEASGLNVHGYINGLKLFTYRATNDGKFVGATKYEFIKALCIAARRLADFKNVYVTRKMNYRIGIANLYENIGYFVSVDKRAVQALWEILSKSFRYKRIREVMKVYMDDIRMAASKKALEKAIITLASKIEEGS